MACRWRSSWRRRAARCSAPPALLARLTNRLRSADRRRARPGRPPADTARRDRLELRPAGCRKSSTLFARLAIFVGGCTVDAAEAMYAAELEREIGAGGREPIRASRHSQSSIPVFDGLASLVDNSLLQQMEAADGDARFIDAGDHSRVRAGAVGRQRRARAVAAAHARLLSAAGRAGRAGAGPAAAGDWLERLEREHDNLLAALGWAREQKAAEVALRLCGALWRFWYTRGYLSEGRRWIDQALAMVRSGLAGAACRSAQRAQRASRRQISTDQHGGSRESADRSWRPGVGAR